MKKPPIVKVYEALTVLASERIEVQGYRAMIYSSDHKKSYKVEWLEKKYSSNDNATFWQGYPGYPIIAVLLWQKKLPLSNELLIYFKDINWHELNEKYKRNYELAISSVLEKLDDDIKLKIEQYVNQVYDLLLQLDIEVVRKIS